MTTAEWRIRENEQIQRWVETGDCRTADEIAAAARVRARTASRLRFVASTEFEIDQ